MNSELIEITVTWKTGAKTSRIVKLGSPFALGDGAVFLELNRYQPPPISDKTPSWVTEGLSTEDYIKRCRE